jgi:hypothetical protein
VQDEFSHRFIRGDARRSQREVSATVMIEFDYSLSAQLFPRRNRKYSHQSLRYRRFARAVDAIRFAIEELPPELLVGIFLEVDSKRYASGEIRRLYERSDYPLRRRAAI